MRKKRLIIIPAFNEEERIGLVIDEIKKFLKGVDIVVIDDGSKDRTGEIAFLKGATVLTHPFNFGYGASLQTGFKYAILNDYDYIAQMDADFQHKGEFLPKLFLEIEKGDYDVIVGSRFLKKAGYKIPLFRFLGMKLFSKITSFLIGQKITDPTSGFRVINKKVAKFYTSDFYPTDFPDADVIIMLKLGGAKIKEIPVKMRSSPPKKSMHSGIKPIYYLFKMFFSIFLTLIREKEKI